ncbi:hypothetical protein JNE43_02895 [Kocuria rhizophila]|uniref:hypothetical protein n=1 Tax=Kocuria rhizophila TaxID=72000 RepID=UPI001DCF6433|nr:hypothetical protein [Kocuria rhizophila]MCC5673775.1 hypothetical protein [Kocuria rhizophila]
MSERPHENSGSSSASRHEQPQYGQYAENQQPTGGQQPEYGQYSQGESAASAPHAGGDARYSDASARHDSGAQGGHDRSGQGYGTQGHGTQGYGNQGYGAQNGASQYGTSGRDAAGYPTYYQDGSGHQAYNSPSPYGQNMGPEPGKGLGIASLVLGAVGILTFWFLGLGGLLGLVGLILGIVAVVKVRKAGRGSMTLGVVGLVLSALALIGGAVVAVATVWLFSTAGDCAQYADQSDQTAMEQCLNEKMGLSTTAP